MIDDVGMLKVGEIAESLKVSPMLIYREVKKGNLRSLRVGDSIRVRADDFEEYLERNSRGGECPLCTAYHDQVTRLRAENEELRYKLEELWGGGEDE